MYHDTTDLWQWVPGQQIWLWGHTSQPQSHWRRWWTSHHGLPQACGWASGRLAGCRAPDSRAPSRCSPSEHQPGLHGRRCTHAEREKEERLRSGKTQGMTLTFVVGIMNLASFTCWDMSELFAHCHLVEAKTYMGKEGWSSKYKQKICCSCHQISCDRLMCKAHELKRRSSSINNWAFNFALQKTTNSKRLDLWIWSLLLPMALC